MYQQQNWGPQGPQQGMNHIQGKGAPPPTAGGSPRPINQLKQHLAGHLMHKGGYAGAQSPTPPQNYNGPGMHSPMGPPQMQPHGPHQLPRGE